MADKIPAFKTDQVLRQRWANVFWTNPEYQSDPEGPLKAAQQVAQLYPEYQAQPQQAAATPQAQAQPTPETPEQSAPARAEVLKKGAMHGGGQRAKSSVVTIDPKMREMAKQWGVSEESLKRVI